MKDGLLGKVPFVTILVTLGMAATFAASQLGGGSEGGQYEELLLRAQVFYERNAGVELNARSRNLLGHDFVARVQAEHAAAHDKPTFSKRMRDRTQAKFDRVVEAALEARMLEDPAWSEGISGPNVPATRYLTYAFFHEGWLAFGVTLVFLLIAGLGLEATWGALVQAPLVVVSIVAGGLVFAHVDAAGQMPLTGGGPLVAALLAAYLVRGIGGQLPLPGALLLPAWLFVDALFVRGIWIENVGDWPIATLGVSMVLGAGLAGAVKLMGLDARLVDKVDSLADGRHPALEAADRSMTLGRPQDAFEVLSTAAADEPRNTELALALWDAAIEVGRADEVAHAILPIVQSELRSGDVEAATTHWRQLMACGAPVDANTTLLVRMGEALLDSGEPEQALDTLRRALDAPGQMGSALAQRVVRIARDLDPVLTARAAEAALLDPQIAADTRADLETLAGASGAGAASWQAEAAPVAESAPSAAGSSTAAHAAGDTRAAGDDIDADLGEPAPGAGDAMPGPGAEPDLGGLDDLDGLDAGDIDLSHVGDLASPDDFAELDTAPQGLPPMGGEAGAVETDPNALSIHSIEREFAGGLDDETPADVLGGQGGEAAGPALGEAPGPAFGETPAGLLGGDTTDAPSDLAGGEPEAWNDPGRVEDLSGELDADGPALLGESDLDQPMVDNSFLEAGALSADALSSDAADLGDDIGGGRSDLTADALSGEPGAAPSGDAGASLSGGLDDLGAGDPLSGGLDDLSGGASLSGGLDDLSGGLDDLSGGASLSGGPGDPTSDATDPLAMPDLLDPAPLGEPSPLADPGAVDDPQTPPTEPLLDREMMAAKLEQARAEARPPIVSANEPPAPAPPAPPVQPTAPAATPESERTTVVEGLETAGAGATSRALKVLDAVPLALEAEAIKFDVEGRGKTRLPFERVDAVAVAAVSGLSAKPVLVIDFVLNWAGGANEPLKVIRVRSDGFNPTAVVGAGAAPLESIKMLIRRVLDGAQATPLPDVGAVMGSPFSTQPDLASYERDVLQAG